MAGSLPYTLLIRHTPVESDRICDAIRSTKNCWGDRFTRLYILTDHITTVDYLVKDWFSDVEWMPYSGLVDTLRHISGTDCLFGLLGHRDLMVTRTEPGDLESLRTNYSIEYCPIRLIPIYPLGTSGVPSKESAWTARSKLLKGSEQLIGNETPHLARRFEQVYWSLGYVGMGNQYSACHTKEATYNPVTEPWWCWEHYRDILMRRHDQAKDGQTVLNAIDRDILESDLKYNYHRKKNGCKPL